MRALVLAFSIGLLGCDALLGIEELPRGSVTEDASGGDADAAPVPNEACIAAETTSCTAERAACVADGTCSPLLRCLEFCQPGEVICRVDCERANKAAVTTEKFKAIDLCRRKSAVNECFGVFGYGTAFDGGCGCMDTLCAGETLACIQSGVATGESPGACDRRISCTARQPNPDNTVDCVMDNLAGGNEANALLDCMRQNNCPGGCAVSEGMFECTSKFTYANAAGVTEVSGFTVGLQDLDKRGIAGAKIVACSAANCAPDCKQLDVATTDADGKAVFQHLPMVEGGFDGCLFVPTFGAGDNMQMNIVSGRHIHRNESMITSYSFPEGILEVYSPGSLLYDAAYGNVVVAVHDCIWGRAAGVSLEMSGTDKDKTKLAYLRGTKVVVGATETTSSGAAAWINVPVGPHTISVMRKGVLVAKQDITVRGRELTDVNIYPLEGK